MAGVGRLAVWVALLAGIAGGLTGWVGGRGVPALAVSPRSSRSLARSCLAIAAAGSATATAVLGLALLRNDLSWAYVADHSRRGASRPYRLSALWGGMAGSLLVFSTLAAAVGWIAAGRLRRASAGQGVAAAVPAALVAALSGLVLAFADPFRQLAAPAVDGAGLTPILEHPAMLYHPPLLYLGLASLTAPFALTLATLTRPVPAPDVGSYRLGLSALWVPWTLLALGMVAGAHWAYVELGWGGYWAWDPVENTALLPFLAVTLALHASLTAPRRLGPYALVCLAFLLALTGTMLTRSGAVPSVHAFAEDRAIGRALAALVGATAIGVATVLWRSWRSTPTSATGGDAGHRRRAGGARPPGWRLGWLVAGHLAVVGSVLAVTLVGTLTPLVSEITGGDDRAVEGHYFAAFAGPLAAVGLALVALVPILGPSAGRDRGRRLAASLWAVLGAGIGLAALGAGGGRLDLPPLILGAAAGAALVSAVAELARRVRRPRGDGRSDNGGPRATAPATATRRPLAGQVAHAGLGLLLLGVAGTATGATERIAARPGDTVRVLGVAVDYHGVSVEERPSAGTGTSTGSGATSAVIAEVRTAGQDLEPSLVAYPERRQLLAETSLISTPRRDIQVALRDARDNGTAVLEIGVHPLQQLVWWGALVLVAAGPILAWDRRRRPTASPAPAAQQRPTVDEPVPALTGA
jgi:cytochrome c-type biogenesis protein CcmF